MEDIIKELKISSCKFNKPLDLVKRSFAKAERNIALFDINFAKAEMYFA